MIYPWLRNPKLLVFIPVLLLLLIAVACGEDATPTPVPTATPSPTATPVPTATPSPTATAVPTGPVPILGGILPVEGFPGVQGWDPHKYGPIEVIMANGNIYNQLVEYNPLNVSEIIGDLVESWDVSDDGLTFTFNLIKGVKWTDGEVVDADDVVFSLKRMVDPETSGSRTGKFKPYLADGDPIRKVDEDSVSVNLAFPAGAFLPFMAVDFNKILPKHVLDAGVDIDIYDKDAVGTGPFKRVDYKEGTSYEYEKNPGYFKEGRPYIDGIKGFIITEKGTEIAAFKTGRVLMGMGVIHQMDVEDALKLEADSDFTSKTDMFWVPGGGQVVWMNNEAPPFDDSRVRRAIFLGFDRQELMDHFGKGKYRIGWPVSQANPFAIPEEEILQTPGYRQLNGEKHPDDIAEAKKLLAEAGYADGFKVTLLTATITWWPDGAQIMQARFKKDFNIDLEIVLSDIGSAFGKLNKGDYEIAIFGAGSMIPDPDDRFSNVYLKDGGANRSTYSIPEVDELFLKQQSELDPDKRREINFEMQRIVAAGDFPIIELFWPAKPVPVSKRIRTLAGGFVEKANIYTVLKHDHEWIAPE